MGRGTFQRPSPREFFGRRGHGPDERIDIHPPNLERTLWISQHGATKDDKRGFGCEFRRNPAGDSDLMSATVPI
jgi:hypothetical protein